MSSFRILKITIAYIVLLLLIMSQFSWAQICFKGQPSPECRMFMLTEFGGVLRLGGKSAGALEQRMNWELGAMFNLNKKHALGATLYSSLSKNSELFGGAKARYRFWLNSAFSLDTGAGMMWRLNYIKGGTNFTGHVGINFRDYLTLMIQFDVLEKTIASLGIKTGAWLGTSTGILAAVVGGVVYIISRLE